MSDDFSTLFEFLPIGAYRSAPDGTMLRANAALARMNGYDCERDLLAAVHATGAAWYVEPGRRAVFREQLARDGQVEGFVSEVRRHRTGESVWVRESAVVVRDADGNFAFYEGCIEEVTTQVRAEQERARSEARLQEVLALLPGAVFRVAIDGDGRRHYQLVSEGVRELYGIEPAEALADGLALARRRHPLDRQRVEALNEAAIAASRPVAYESRLLLDDGRERWVQLLSAPAPDEDGKRVRVGILLDISDRKRAEQALLDNSELWKRALESTGDGVWDWQVQDGIEILSPKCKALYGYGDEELPDRPDALDALTHPDDREAMAQARAAHFAGLTPAYVNEHRVRCKDGQWKWILSRGLVLSRDAQGQPLRVIGTHTDITARKQAEALRRERDRAAAADLAKSQFLSRVSHELRTPLNAILGFTQLLELDLVDRPRQREWTRQVLASGRHLLALVDDLLELSSIQTGQTQLRLESVDLAATVGEAASMLGATAREAGVALQIELTPDSTPRVRADARRLRQIVSNLLSNAIKYNSPGGWARVEAQRDGAQVEIRVSDSGRGLDEAQIARLFTPFERVGAQNTPIAGSGLGLALSHELATAMEGSLEVESRPGAGSTFRLRLPAG